VRNVIVWHRPNPAPSDLGDKVRPSTSYITVATRSPKRWFDLGGGGGGGGGGGDAVRHSAQQQSPRSTNGPQSLALRHLERGSPGFAVRTDSNPAGAPPLDCWFDEHDEIDLGEFTDDSHETWTMPTESSTLAHYAMWPSKLAERLILMMCPAEVCTVCGEPRRRQTVTTNAVGHAVGRTAWGGTKDQSTTDLHHSGAITVDANHHSVPDVSARETVGWSDCGHGAFGAGTVLGIRSPAPGPPSRSPTCSDATGSASTSTRPRSPCTRAGGSSVSGRCSPPAAR